MIQNVFKIYNGTTNFFQWQTGQKLIVLDDNVIEVRFSNKNMEHIKRRPVYTDDDGQRVCNVPDILLQLPRNLIATAYTKDKDGAYLFVKEVKFAVYQQPLPPNYVCEQEEEYASDAPVQLGTLAEWNESLIPVRKGVLCFATSIDPETNSPIFMVKVGDGTRLFRDLPWTSCDSEANVIEACKTEASLKAFIDKVLSDAGIGTDEVLRDLEERLDAVEHSNTGLSQAVASQTQLMVALRELVGEKKVADQISDAIVLLDLSSKYAAINHKHSKDDINDFEHSHDIADISGLQAAIDAKQPAGNYATHDDAKGYADEKDKLINEAKQDAASANSAIKSLSDKIGMVDEGKTVVEMIAQASGAVKSVNGKVGNVVLSASDIGALDADSLENAVNAALQEAKDSGDFDGAQGVPGVYLGSGDMPEGYSVQIDPDGEPLDENFIEDLISEAISKYDANASTYLDQASAAIDEALAMLGEEGEIL